jgi:D-alanyl-lipoteichoic acid acyltransferase DltB (MBOAT superfamily)
LLFNSLLFGAFFAVVFALHWQLPRRARNTLLLVASQVFYGTWSWRLLTLLWLTAAIDYAAARILAADASPWIRRAALLASLGGNLAVLGFFKYYNFFVDSLELMLSPWSVDVARLHLDLVLPVGISFYTFRAMSYVIDVYRGQLPPIRSFLDYLLFVTFFPQLVAGPIERVAHLLPQIHGERRLTAEAVHEGVFLLVWGLFKKIVIADNLSRIVDPVYAQSVAPAGPLVLVATYAFAFQLYADFSSYTDMARGMARLLGFDLMRNFDTPYFARDPQEFWRRWHMSLSTWLRDYLYVPLGGNRGGEPRVALHLITTFVLAGLWHGAGANFLVWGLFHGVLVVGVRLYRRTRPVREAALLWPGALLTFHLWTLSMVWFRSPTVVQSVSFLRAMALDWRWEPAVPPALVVLLLCALPLLAFDALWRRAGSEFFCLRWPIHWYTLAYVVLVHLMIVFGRSDGLEFIYFQF